MTATPASPIDIRPLSVFTGAGIHGVDLRQRLSDEQVQAIRVALLGWKVDGWPAPVYASEPVSGGR